MALDLMNIAADFSRNFLKPLESGNSLRATAHFEIFREVTIVRNQDETLSDKQFDGYFVGENGQIFAPDTPFGEIPAVTPAGGVGNAEILIYINGICTSIAGQAKSLQAIADTTASPVIGIFNATEDFGPEILQNSGDKHDIGDNKAIDTLADTIYNELRAARGVQLLAHSKGALVTSRALHDVKNRLMLEDGISRRQTKTLMNRIKIETFGGAARRYTEGPQFVHYINYNDGRLEAFGLRSWLNSFAHEECESVTHYFRAGKPLVSYGFEDFYLPERIPFEAARQFLNDVKLL